MAAENILALLADGEFHSGEELGGALGVSRTAVWKQLQKLAELGLELESVKGRGYRLCGGFQALDASAVLNHLDAPAADLLSGLDVHQSIESTSTALSQRLGSGIGCGHVCVAEQQLAGRGRLGRRWASPYGRNLTFSVLWEFEGGAAALEGLSLVTGLAVADALESLGTPDLQLKWPNDVLCARRKLAGILLEMHGDAAGSCQVVIGIGINVDMPDGAGAEITQPWTDLRRAGLGEVDRNRVLAAVLGKLLPALQHFADVGFAAFHERWAERDALAGREVAIIRGDARVYGQCRGVASNGALRFEGENGLELISGGEVSLRALDDS